MSIEPSQKIENFVYSFSLYQVWLRDAISSIDASFPRLAPLKRDNKVSVLPYVTERPYKFFDLITYQKIANFLSTVSQSGSITIPADYESQLQNALALLRVTNQTSKEYVLDYSLHPEIIQEQLRTTVFVEYARLAEYILVGLIRPLLCVFYEHQGRKTHKLASQDHRSVIEQADQHLLKRSKIYNPAVRNAIAHGSIEFDEENRNVKFTAENGECTDMSLSESASLAEKLLDACNGIAVAIFEAEGLGLLLQNSAITIQNRSIALMQTAYLRPHTYYIKQRHDGAQLEIHGKCSHWNFGEFMLDVMRSLVIAKNYHPTIKRFVLNYQDSRSIPFFFRVEADDIPEYKSDVRELSILRRKMAQNGFAKIVHTRPLIRFICKFPHSAFVFNWAHEIDRALDPGGHAPSYELRSIYNISVDRHSRFKARVISRPRPIDLDDEGTPVRSYLKYLLNETLLRWTIRNIPGNDIEPKYLKIFKTAIIFVYMFDRRLSTLNREVNSENLLFRFEFSLWSPLRAIPLSNENGEGSIEPIGPYIVSVNPLARAMLANIKRADAT